MIYTNGFVHIRKYELAKDIVSETIIDALKGIKS